MNVEIGSSNCTAVTCECRDRGVVIVQLLHVNVEIGE